MICHVSTPVMETLNFLMSAGITWTEHFCDVMLIELQNTMTNLYSSHETGIIETQYGLGFLYVDNI